MEISYHRSIVPALLAYKQICSHKNARLYYSKIKGEFAVISGEAPTVSPGLQKMSFKTILHALYQSNKLTRDGVLLSETIKHMNRKRSSTAVSHTLLGKLIQLVCRITAKFFNLTQGFGFLTTSEKVTKVMHRYNQYKAIEVSKGKCGKLPGETTHQFRSRIYQQTMSVCQVGAYCLNETVHSFGSDLDFMIKNTLRFDHIPALEAPELKKMRTRFTVIEDDTLNVMKKHAHEGHPVVGGNMTNAYDNGLPAQDENITMRSSQAFGLIKEESWSPLSEFGGIYFPLVNFFREDESKGFAFMDKPFRADLVAMAAYDLRKGSSDLKLLGLKDNFNEEDLKTNIKYMEGTKNKIRNMLRVITLSEIQYLVLGALGCEAFQNPPKIMAGLFKEIFNQEEEFMGRFIEVDFSINEKD